MPSAAEFQPEGFDPGQNKPGKEQLPGSPDTSNVIPFGRKKDALGQTPANLYRNNNFDVPYLSGPAADIFDGFDGKKRIEGIMTYALGSDTDPYDLGTYIVVNGVPQDIDPTKEPLERNGMLDISVMRLRLGHVDPKNPSAEPTIIKEQEVIREGRFTNPTTAFKEGETYLKEREAWIKEEKARFELPAQETRNTLPRKERRKQVEEERAKRQKELDAIVVEDNEHDDIAPIFERNTKFWEGKGKGVGIVVGVESLTLGSDDPKDRTVFTYLEAVARSDSGRAQINIPHQEDKELAYDVNLVTIFLMDADGKDADDAGPHITKVPLIEKTSIRSAVEALKHGKKQFLKIQTEINELNEQLNAPPAETREVRGEQQAPVDPDARIKQALEGRYQGDKARELDRINNKIIEARVQAEIDRLEDVPDLSTLQKTINNAHRFVDSLSDEARDKYAELLQGKGGKEALIQAFDKEALEAQQQEARRGMEADQIKQDGTDIASLYRGEDTPDQPAQQDISTQYGLPPQEGTPPQPDTHKREQPPKEPPLLPEE